MGISKDCSRSYFRSTIAKMQILFSFVCFFALHGRMKQSFGAKKCYLGDPPKDFYKEDCPDNKPKCYISKYKVGKSVLIPPEYLYCNADGTTCRGCAQSALKDGCQDVKRAKPYPLGKEEYTICACDEDYCNWDFPEPTEEPTEEPENVASCILLSYTLWLSTFVATTWWNYAFECI